MCRLLGYCSSHEASVEDLIGADGLRGFTGLCALHGDGWGMASVSYTHLTLPTTPYV